MLSKRSTLGLDLIPSNQGQHGGYSEYSQQNQDKNRNVGIGVKEPDSYPDSWKWDRLPYRQQKLPLDTRAKRLKRRETRRGNTSRWRSNERIAS